MSRQPGVSKAKRTPKRQEGVAAKPSGSTRRRAPGRGKAAAKPPLSRGSGYRLWVELALVGVAGFALQWFAGPRDRG